MATLSRADAEDLAAQVCEALRPQILRVVTDILAGEEDDGLTAEQRAKVDRTVSTWRKRVSGKSG